MFLFHSDCWAFNYNNFWLQSFKIKILSNRTGPLLKLSWNVFAFEHIFHSIFFKETASLQSYTIWYNPHSHQVLCLLLFILNNSHEAKTLSENVTCTTKRLSKRAKQTNLWLNTSFKRWNLSFQANDDVIKKFTYPRWVSVFFLSLSVLIWLRNPFFTMAVLSTMLS